MKNENAFKPGDRFLGFRVVRVVPLNHIAAVFHELHHAPTGARMVHVYRDDPENTFSVTFKTVPTDSTGVAHILEHTVLCGSEKYPVRDPFFSMIKRSLNTFMNAFTASDWTMYPFSTQNEKDFYNLLDVYLDAAFLPRLDALNFKQEGHRLAFEGDALTYKGVVYNEMKGAMSSPDQVLYRSLMKALCPDNTYRNNSGGDPADIPTLTHGQLRAFHQRHYHPSNAYIYTYGHLPLAPILTFIEEKILSRFDAIDPQTEVSSQPRWDAPVAVSQPYPLDPAEDPTRKYQHCLSWLTADIRDTLDILGLSLLSEILLGNPASPLRKALIDSGIGSALSDGTGFSADYRDAVFTAGLKDVTANDGERIETLIRDTLSKLATGGIDPDLIDAAIHQLEFHRKEITNSPYPYGLKLLLSFCGTWIHGGDPLSALDFDADLNRIKTAAAEERFFEELIRTRLLDNPHMVRFTLVPDQRMAAEEEAAVSRELAAVQETLTEAEKARIAAESAELEALQEAKEDLSVLPTLELSDIQPHIHTVAAGPPPADVPAQHPVTWYDQPTSDILYLSCAAGIDDVPAHLLPLVPFFCYIMPKVGTKRHDYGTMAQRIDRYTGGIGFSQNARTAHGARSRCLPYVSMGGKCLGENIQPMFAILSELLSEATFTDIPRIRRLLLEYKAGLESGIVHNGHRFAISLASRNFSATRWMNEQWQGIHQLKYIKQLADRSEEALSGIAADLGAIAASLFTRGNLKMALVGESAALSRAGEPLSELLDSVRPGSGTTFAAPDVTLAPPPAEGWSTATAVSFVARTFETVRLEHSDAPTLAVIGKMLRSLYLHREIREKGGAYGGFSIYNPEDGLFAFGSYRDPHILNTLSVFEKAGGFIREGDYSDEDVKEAILQVCSEIDKPDPPGPAARKAFYRSLIGLTDDIRRRFKTQLLGVTRRNVMECANRYFKPDEKRRGTAVISNAEKLAAANAELKESALDLHAI